jgi:hypothetical protein
LDQDLVGANCKYVQVNTTVQILNIYELANLTEYFLNNYRSINRIPYFCLLTEPSYLSIQVLPKNAKEEAERVLRLGLARIAANHPAEGERFRIAVEGVISHLWASDKTSLLPKLRKATEIMDLNRSQSTRQSVPELRQVL